MNGSTGMHSRPPTTRSNARLTAMLKRLSSTWPTSSSGMPSTSSTSACELTTSNRRGTMFTFTPLSAQARTMRRKSLCRALEKATMTRSTPSCSTMASRSARLPMTGSDGAVVPFRRGSPSSRNPTTSIRYSGCAAILAASVWPTSPAPMIRTRSLNDARDHTVTLPTHRASGTRTIIRNQKAISGATGVCGPMHQDEDDQQQPARGRQRRQAGQTLTEVEPADAARGLAVHAVDPQSREPVRRETHEHEHADAGCRSRRDR